MARTYDRNTEYKQRVWEKRMKIIIPFKTPTVNHLYWHRGNIKILTKEARALREKIEIIINEEKGNHEGFLNYIDKKLNVRIYVYENWLTKKGDIKKKDIMNRQKFIVDSIFKTLGIDDKYIWEYSMKKIQSNEEKSIIEIKF